MITNRFDKTAHIRKKIRKNSNFLSSQNDEYFPLDKYERFRSRKTKNYYYSRKLFKAKGRIIFVFLVKSETGRQKYSTVEDITYERPDVHKFFTIHGRNNIIRNAVIGARVAHIAHTGTNSQSSKIDVTLIDFIIKYFTTANTLKVKLKTQKGQNKVYFYSKISNKYEEQTERTTKSLNQKEINKIAQEENTFTTSRSKLPIQDIITLEKYYEQRRKRAEKIKKLGL